AGDQEPAQQSALWNDGGGGGGSWDQLGAGGNRRAGTGAPGGAGCPTGRRERLCGRRPLFFHPDQHFPGVVQPASDPAVRWITYRRRSAAAWSSASLRQAASVRFPLTVLAPARDPVVLPPLGDCRTGSAAAGRVGGEPVH